MDPSEAPSRDLDGYMADDDTDDAAVQQVIWDTARPTLTPSVPAQPLYENIDTETKTLNPQELEDKGAKDAVPDSAAPARRTIDDCINDIQADKATSWDHVARPDVRDGDTWVFIQPPPREPNQSDTLYKHVVARYSVPFRLRSRNLRASESVEILRQLNNPTVQFRSIRRHNVKHLMGAQGIAYVLDLTPPVEGDEAVSIVQELSCPPSVVQWVRTSQQWRVGSTMVGGLDELTQTSDESMETRPLVPDYSPIRHRMCIERVLALLHEQDVKFDSAPKLYTTVMVATKHLKIPSHRLDSLKGYVMGWARAPPNSMIMEQHPEVMLRLANELQLEQMCQDSFAILVGEAALLVTARGDPNVAITKGHTVHGRERGLLDEAWQSRIEFARDILVERTKNAFFKNIVGEKMSWVENLQMVKDLGTLATSNDKSDLYETWLEKLKDYLRGALYSVIAGRYTKVDTPPQGFRKTETFDRFLFRDIFNKLGFQEGVMTRTFWKAVRDTVMARKSNTALNIHVHPSVASFTKDQSLGSETTIYALVNTKVVVKVSVANLDGLTHALQEGNEDDFSDEPEDTESTRTRVGDELENDSRKRVRFSMSGKRHDSGGKLLDLPIRAKEDSNGPLRITNPDLISGSLHKDLNMAQTQQAKQSIFYDSGSTDAFPTIHSQLAEAKSSGSDAPTNTENGELRQRGSVPQRLAGFNAVDFLNQMDGVSAADAISTIGDSNNQAATQLDQIPETDADSASSPIIPTAGANLGQPVASDWWTRWDPSGDPKQPDHLRYPRLGRGLQEALSTPMGTRKRSKIYINQVLLQAQDYLPTLAAPFLAQPNYNTVELDTIDTLVCLQETETKVLPLWAGGMDDGTGGVFNDEVPILDGDDGFGPGRDGLRAGDSELGFAGVGSSIAGSSANTSRLVNDGHSVIADRRQVYAASEIESVGHPPPSIASDSTWAHISATHTPAESLSGDLEESPAFSDTGSVIYAPSSGVSDDEDGQNKKIKKDEKEDISMEDRQDYADMFMDSGDEDFDEDDYENPNSDGEMNDSDDSNDRVGGEWDTLESEDERPGTAKSDAYTADKKPATTDNAHNPLYGYREREQTPLTFSEMD